MHVLVELGPMSVSICVIVRNEQKRVDHLVLQTYYLEMLIKFTIKGTYSDKKTIIEISLE